MLRLTRRGLAYRRGSFLLVSMSVALVATLVLLIGWAGLTLRAHQRATMQRLSPLRVVATTPDVADAGKRFSPNRIEWLKSLPGVAAAQPFVEAGVLLDGLGSGPSGGAATLEATLPGAVHDRVTVGRDVHRPGEVIVGPALLESLGGDAAAVSRGESVSLDLSARRTLDGVAQTRRMRLNVVGLLRFDPPDDRLYAHLADVDAIDRWSAGRDAAEAPIRAAVEATDLDALPVVVATLRRSGYLTLDRLEERDTLARMDRAMLVTIGGIGVGLLVLAGSCVVLGGWITLDAKRRRSALLDLDGFGRTCAVRLGLCEASFHWLAALVLAGATAAIVQVLAGPFLASHLPAGLTEVFAASPPPLSLAMWPMLAAVVGLCLACSVLGVLLPAAGELPLLQRWLRS